MVILTTEILKMEIVAVLESSKTSTITAFEILRKIKGTLETFEFYNAFDFVLDYYKDKYIRIPNPIRSDNDIVYIRR